MPTYNLKLSSGLSFMECKFSVCWTFWRGSEFSWFLTLNCSTPFQISCRQMERTNRHPCTLIRSQSVINLIHQTSHCSSFVQQVNCLRGVETEPQGAGFIIQCLIDSYFLQPSQTGYHRLVSYIIRKFCDNGKLRALIHMKCDITFPFR